MYTLRCESYKDFGIWLKLLTDAINNAEKRYLPQRCLLVFKDRDYSKLLELIPLHKNQYSFGVGTKTRKPPIVDARYLQSVQMDNSSRSCTIASTDEDQCFFAVLSNLLAKEANDSLTIDESGTHESVIDTQNDDSDLGVEDEDEDDLLTVTTQPILI